MEAHGKIILIGEHSVVYGKSAIALPLTNLKTTCTIQKINGKCFFESEYYTGLLENAVNQPFYEAIKISFEYLNKKMENLKFTIDSSIPIQRGLGSSAATSIALIRAIFSHFKAALSFDLLYKLSLTAEKVAHENPSGLDSLLCSSTCPYYFTKKKFKKIESSLNAYLVIADSEVRGKTKEAVLKVKKNYDSAKIDLLHQYSEFIYTHYSHDYLLEIGQHLSLAHEILKSLGVSLPLVDEYISLAQKYSLGAKISGGGLGGCFISLCHSEKQALILKEKLHEKGVKSIWIQKI